MRKIAKEAVQAFIEGIPYRNNNTEVKVLPNVTVLALHGNKIAYQYNDPEKTLSVTNCGWFSNTTKERLNSIPGVNVFQKKGKWYLNGVEWDGSLTDVKQ